jgi:hypothetical protein
MAWSDSKPSSHLVGSSGSGSSSWSFACRKVVAADWRCDGNQVHPLRSTVPSIRGKANRHPSTRVFGSHLVLDDGRSRKQAARFQDVLQQPSHAYLTGRANAGYARVTTNRQSPLVSMAATLSILVSDTSGCLIYQRFALAVVSGQLLQKPRMKSSGVCVVGCTAFRGLDRFTAIVLIRQRHVVVLIKLLEYRAKRPSYAQIAKDLFPERFGSTRGCPARTRYLR